MMFEEFCDTVKMSNHDWKHVATRLSSKLNAIAFELDFIERNGSMVDCVLMARELKSKFNLELNGDYVKPDFDQLSDLSDDLGTLLAKFHFAPFAKRDALEEKILKKHSELSFALCVYGAFV